MKKLLAWLFGAVQVTVTGVQPELLLNLCAKEGVLLWKTIWRDPFCLELQVPQRQYALLCTLARRAQCETALQRRWGVPVFFRRFRRRYALLAGLLACLVLGALGSQVILTIEVSGNVNLTAEEIISRLRLCGVEVGSFGPSIPTREKENQLMLAMDELSFCALNRRGTCLEVLVREAGDSPEVKDQSQPTDVIATATGRVTHIEPWGGDALFQEGDMVVKGDVLISGIMDLDAPPNVVLEQGVESFGTKLAHAEGKVLAETWHSLSANLDLNAPVKAYTGEETSRHSLSIMGRRVKFYQNSGIPYEKYDTITELKSWTPVEGKTLPIVWETERVREYTLTTAPLDQSKGEALLRQELRRRLESAMDQGEVLTAEYETALEGSVLTVKLRAQCLEQIGRMVPIDTQEKVTAPEHPPWRDPTKPIEETQTTEDSP